MAERRHFRFFPTRAESGTRLDQFIPARTEELSRTLLRRVIELGGAHVGGRRARRCSQPVQEGETVEVFLDGGSLDPWRLAAGDILYRDRYLIAVCKPAGIETQPTPARYKGTLYEALLTYLHDPFRPQQRPSLGMVQRLDRDTSGVLVFSIHPRAHRNLSTAAAAGRLRKTYLALTAGRPGAGEIRSQLARGRAGNLMKSVERGGKEAITRFRPLEGFADATLLEVEIPTGRSHQIRVHLSESGHPLLGDERYGGPRVLRDRAIPRQMLHAWRLQLQHPVSGEELNLESPLPGDLEGLLAFLRESPAAP